MQINKIQVKRGAGKPNNDVLDSGELGYDTINKKLYVGNITTDGNPAAPTLINSIKSVNGKTDTVILNASDVGALPDSTIIPSKLGDLANDKQYITAAEIDGLLTDETFVNNVADEVKQRVPLVKTVVFIS